MEISRVKYCIHIALISTLALGACKNSQTEIEPQQEYLQFLETFNTNYPGRGTIDYPGSPTVDNAKSYAMVLNAELNRMVYEDSDLSEYGKNAGNWLIENLITDDFGNKGWGINSEWDAFGDSTVNPANTIYTISTTIVIEALLNWVELDNEADERKIWSLIDQVIEPYVSKKSKSKMGLFPYSCNPNDFGFNCYNPAIHLAGQLQRISSIHPDIEKRRMPAQTASNNMMILLESKKKSKKGYWFWQYSDLESNPNDLPHALYVINGINTYINYGGSLASQFNLAKVNGHIFDFFDEKTGWHSWPVFRKDIQVNPEPRLYDLGYVLAFTSRFFPNRADEIYELSKKYQSDNGFYRRYISDTTYINEYQSYMLNGLSTYWFREGQRKKTSKENHTYTSSDDEVPFTSLSTNFTRIGFHFDTLKQSSYLKIAKQKISINNNIPLSIEEKDSLFYVFCRKQISNEFSILLIKNKEIETAIIPLNHRKLSFRKSFMFENKIYVILYNPEKNMNYLFKLQGSGASAKLKEVAKINLNEFLGYNHQPNFIVKTLYNHCYILAANRLFILNDSEKIKTIEFNTNTELIDIAVSSRNQKILAKHVDKPVYDKNNNFRNQYFLIPLQDTSRKIFLDSTKIYYDLRIVGDKTIIQEVDNKKQAYDYLVWNLTHMNNNGVMSFGVNNYEGEVVWTQSYYLSGMNDFLFLYSNLKSKDSQLNSLAAEFDKRLNIEVSVLYNLLADSIGLKCKTFTTNRSAVLHAVQTGKTTLLLSRLRAERNIGNQKMFEAFAKKTFELEDHIETFSNAGENYPKKKDYSCIVWPKGVNFKYDGNVIPFNHQNCWAASVLFNCEYSDSTQKSIAQDIVYTLIELELEHRYRNNKEDFYWNYWWGIAKNGWTIKDNISLNTPNWAGDGESVALARYRTFDAISILGLKYVKQKNSVELISYLKKATHKGALELFIIPYFIKTNNKFSTDKISPHIILHNHKFDSQPSLRNSLIAWMINYQSLK